ncbi:3-dehydroquinate synthase [Psychroflexus salis]|uniref:3-dehydroquinate synthase n=1 Tax=Psychroflexus salis TaxID=1526574 RepID=A0A916ZQZ4_9FLAO|nr:3-dehydroquinate synthase [Psychroflexus salis]GGE09727.1 3-dehydroquinate synthase [Psychroflexus salis]
MKSLQLGESKIYFGDEIYKALNLQLQNGSYSSVFIFTDTNVHQKVAYLLLEKLSTNLKIEVIEIEPGEESKNISVCNETWKALSDLGADRNSLILNLGGGVVTDLGGFIASTFRRGIDFIHVPTSLLGMVDASLGGKNGIDLGHLKNQIGTIVLPKMVLIHTDFLTSLPIEEYRSGLAEMIKHGIIYSQPYFSYFEKLHNYDAAFLMQLIYDSVQIKCNIVEADPFEKNERKTLNFGHTLGHAIESYFMLNEDKKRLLHGEAIAIGMVLESYLSHKKLQLNKNELEQISKVISTTYKAVQFNAKDIDEIIQLLKFDKKNKGAQINFVLLNNIGNCSIDQQVENDLILEAFNYYSKL